MVAAAVLLLAACQDLPGPSAPLDPAAAVLGGQAAEVIVLLDPAFAAGSHEANRGRAAQVAAQLGVEPTQTYGTAVFGFSGPVPPGRLQALERDPRVVLVEPVEYWGLDVIRHESGDTDGGQVPSQGFGRIEADRVLSIGNPELPVTVALDLAIIETGIDPTHPELNVAGGRNFVGTSPDPDAWTDDRGHGTHVGGIAAARDNDIGVVGVAPGARLWAIKVCNENGQCASSAMIAGIDWVADRKATGAIDFAAANMSISTPDSDRQCGAQGRPLGAIHQAVCRLFDTGVVFVLSAGNADRERQPFPVALSVSALADFDGLAGGNAPTTCGNPPHTDDALANWSNHGPAIDMAAPGTCILSTVPGGGYASWGGTSMAAPHVAGAVALYLHANGFTPARDAAGGQAIKDAVIAAGHPQGSANDVCSYDDERLGGRLLFVNGAAFGGDGACDVADPPPPPPTGSIAGTVSEAGAEHGIGGATVSVSVDGTDHSAITNELGEYVIDGVPVGSHQVTASAEGYASATKDVDVTENVTAILHFALEADPSAPPAATVSVDRIVYATHGGGRHLTVTVHLVDGDGAAVSGAAVDIELYRNDALYGSASGTTGSDGTVSFGFNNFPAGTYTTLVMSVSASGLTWDGVTPANSFTK